MLEKGEYFLWLIPSRRGKDSGERTTLVLNRGESALAERFFGLIRFFTPQSTAMGMRGTTLFQSTEGRRMTVENDFVIGLHECM